MWAVSLRILGQRFEVLLVKVTNLFPHDTLDAVCGRYIIIFIPEF